MSLGENACVNEPLDEIENITIYHTLFHNYHKNFIFQHKLFLSQSVCLKMNTALINAEFF